MRARRGVSHFGQLLGGSGRWAAVDAAAVLGLLVLVAFAFWPVYGTAWLFVTVLGFGAVGIGIALLATWRRWGAAAVLGATMLAWFVFGGLLAMPSSTVGFVVPTGRTLYGLLLGPVTAWRDMLLLDPPIGETFNLLTVPGLVALVAALAAMLVSLRSSRPMLAFVPLAVAYLVGVLVGTQAAFQPYLTGALFFVTCLVWSTYRRGVDRGRLTGVRARLRPLRLLSGIAMLAVAAAAAVTVAPALAGGHQRETVRAQLEPPISTEQYSSPLQAYRLNITRERTDTLLEVVGAAEGQIVRVATLDEYDGLSYRVSSLDDEAMQATTFTRVGQWIDDDSDGVDGEVDVTVRGLDGVWVPTIGRTTSIAFTGDRAVTLGDSFYYNHSSGTGLATAGLADGDTYTLGARVAQRPADDVIALATAGSYQLPDSAGVPDEIVSLAHAWGDGLATAGDMALTLERNFRQGYFSHGQDDEAASLPGHSARRLITLVTDPSRMIGDHEQYAVAMALMARELGIPARVIYGYRVGSGQTITGDQVGAWPELYLDGLGWVTFDPTPSTDRVWDEEDQPKPPETQPYVENPPPPPQRPVVPPADEELPIDPGEPPQREGQIDWAQIGALVALTGIPLLTVVVPIALILGLKARRRTRRRHDPVTANRVAGAWSELVDRARDIGRSPSISATRSEQAEAMMADFPRLADHGDPVTLAKQADGVVFAPEEPTQADAVAYWAATGAVRRGMRRSVSGFRWAWSFLSTRSFRRTAAGRRRGGHGT